MAQINKQIRTLSVFCFALNAPSKTVNSHQVQMPIGAKQNNKEREMIKTENKTNNKLQQSVQVIEQKEPTRIRTS